MEREQPLVLIRIETESETTVHLRNIERIDNVASSWLDREGRDLVCEHALRDRVLLIFERLGLAQANWLVTRADDRHRERDWRLSEVHRVISEEDFVLDGVGSFARQLVLLEHAEEIDRSGGSVVVKERCIDCARLGTVLQVKLDLKTPAVNKCIRLCHLMGKPFLVQAALAKDILLVRKRTWL